MGQDSEHDRREWEGISLKRSAAVSTPSLRIIGWGGRDVTSSCQSPKGRASSRTTQRP